MYCCFQETSAAMSFVPGSLAAMLCLPCYCMLLTSRSSRRPAICPLSFSTSARGRKLKVPWRLAVHEHSTSTRMSSGTATTTPGGRRLLLLFLSGVFMVVLMMTAMIRPPKPHPKPVRKPVTSTATDICSTHNTPHQCQKRRPPFPVSIRTQSKRIC